jgi:disulfide bond formation protein DsbB
MRQTASSRFHVLAALFLALAMAGTVGTALGFEHIGGFIPCKLCLAQREPYYAGVPVALLALAGAAFGWRGCFTRGMFVIAGLLMSYGVILSIYHSGVEWHWWPGPADCGAAATSGITTNAGDLLGALDSVTPPSCDEAAGRFSDCRLPAGTCWPASRWRWSPVQRAAFSRD